MHRFPKSSAPSASAQTRPRTKASTVQAGKCPLPSLKSAPFISRVRVPHNRLPTSSCTRILTPIPDSLRTHHQTLAAPGSSFENHACLMLFQKNRLRMCEPDAPTVRGWPCRQDPRPVSSRQLMHRLANHSNGFQHNWSEAARKDFRKETLGVAQSLHCAWQPEQHSKGLKRSVIFDVPSQSQSSNPADSPPSSSDLPPSCPPTFMSIEPTLSPVFLVQRLAPPEFPSVLAKSLTTLNGPGLLIWPKHWRSSEGHLFVAEREGRYALYASFAWVVYFGATASPPTTSCATTIVSGVCVEGHSKSAMMST